VLVQTSEAVNRWALIRDVLVFQLKLAVDGFRDLVMMPLSLGVAVFDLLGVGPRAGRQFYDLLKIGKRTDDWIDLFGVTEPAGALPDTSQAGIDMLVHRMERLVVNEYERGGITTSAKEVVDRALDALAEKPSRGSSSSRSDS